MKKTASKPVLLIKKEARYIRKEYQLLILALPAIVYLLIFNYVPMYGIQLAFKNYRPNLGIWGSPWIGGENFVRFFNSANFVRIIKNTILLSALQIAFSFPIPILFALILNQTRNKTFKKYVQTITYAPHFISIVVLVGMLNLFLSPNSGIINHLIVLLGGEKQFFLGEASWFRPIYIISGIWQSTGWNSIIYLAALSSIDPTFYEAAEIDGCSSLKKLLKIDLPLLMPTVVIMLILNVGKLMDIGFQKAFLMQNSLNISVSEIISTYVYKVGLIDARFSYSTAIGLFNTVINFVLLISVNKISKKLTDTSLW